MKSRKVVILITLIVLNLTIYINAKNSLPCRVKATTPLPYRSILDIKHGGSTRTIDSELSDGDDDESTEVKDPNYESEVEEDPESLKRRKKLQKYLLEQHILMQLRSTFLSEALAKRGLPMTTLIDVSTPEGSKPPEIVDWDCAMSTGEEPKTCLYSFDAEPNTKVIAPLGTTQWISLSALNRLRRTDPTKVEPMWHSQYAITKSWFSNDSNFSILQHCGLTGLLLSLILDHAIVLKSLLATTIFLVFLVFLPVLDFAMNRALVSSTVWSSWPQWARFAHAALPLKLLLVQMGFKLLSKSFGKLEQRVKDALVEIECNNLENCTPLTVGQGSEATDEDQYEDENEKQSDFVEIVLEEDILDSADLPVDLDHSLDIGIDNFFETDEDAEINANLALKTEPSTVLPDDFEGTDLETSSLVDAVANFDDDEALDALIQGLIGEDLNDGSI